MNLLYPRFTLRQFGWMLLFGCGGAVIAGSYGIVHDQITFEIGPEYFTDFKFQQFFYLPKTQPERLIVAEIGFLATWWVGFFAGWFMGRLTIPHMPWRKAAGLSLKGVAVMTGTALLAAIMAYAWAPTDQNDPRMENWDGMFAGRDVIDTVAFAQVGYIHNASYLGGLIGLIAALVWMWRKRTRMAKTQ
ncbi:hypothetical protein [Brevifollis gellanilyticus]|uniref:Uncharacterized protein n=1 Tax=Brevifollis gellanilyticus TaxID=748831 RepID=A0A512M7B9_9BACT|nr:hypothetical protein [Brevifollis gellanilyticus]GEP42614.1 hypothetical protein BGE01nite_19050 [Brevifollis gellanilyticus]